MNSQTRSRPGSVERSRAEFFARFEGRRPEIEVAVQARINAISDPNEVADPAYAEGLRAAVSAALDYGFAGVERGEGSPPPIPVILRSQARIDARSGISLDTVLRRYFAGYTLFGDFLVEEAGEGSPLPSSTLKRLLRTQSVVFDRVVTAISEEYKCEAEDRRDSAEERRAERVKRLLAGELLDTTELAYDLDAYHLGVIATGPNAAEAIESLGKAVDHRLLLIRRPEGSAWAWLGTRRRLDASTLEQLVGASFPRGIRMAIGEPARGTAGWRFTHRQACAALPIALRNPGKPVRYADVALLASILQDDLLATSLSELYLEPLSEERDGGKVARQTLRAYFAAERNISSAAAAIGVNRRTVANRLQAIESKLGCSLKVASPEIEAALRLHDLDSTAAASH